MSWKTEPWAMVVNAKDHWIYEQKHPWGRLQIIHSEITPVAHYAYRTISNEGAHVESAVYFTLQVLMEDLSRTMETFSGLGHR